MRIVWIIDYHTYNRKMSRVRFHGIDAIKRHDGIWLHKSGPGWPDWPGAEKVDKKWKPDLVVWYKPLGLPNYEKIKTPRCLRYNEMWGRKWTKHEIKTSDSRLVICHHFNDIAKYAGSLDPKYKLVHNPHCAERTLFRDYGLEKSIDVLFVGVGGAKYYPLRAKFDRTVKPILRARGITFVVHKHPGYALRSLDKVKMQVVYYARNMNRSRIVVSCSSKYRYALAKYVEVPMSGAVLCGDLPNENEEWYKSWMLHVNPEWKAERIAEAIIEVLADKKRLRTLAKKGMEENLKHRTQEDYARRFVKIAEDFLNGRMNSYNFGTDAAKYLNGGDGPI